MQRNQHPVQQLATGEKLSVTSYRFSSSQHGPKVYLQANIHGPEVLGTAVLTKLLPWLHEMETKDMCGSVIVVPCANPMAVQQTAYNSMIGRWNGRSGMNWNRITPLSANGAAIWRSGSFTKGSRTLQTRR
ncbi:succinylglutamate desuccinylase/aspartoacylase family protein [Patescibacteria group bacterium]|nr:succinylglutamate desuccinylase/aspartoacylase family protein [Patescibacteria group bacterium]